MDTEKLLKGLFDLQRFEVCPALESLIRETESRYFGEELSDEALSRLSAAGDPAAPPPPDPKKRRDKP